MLRQTVNLVGMICDGLMTGHNPDSDTVMAEHLPLPIDTADTGAGPC